MDSWPCRVCHHLLYLYYFNFSGLIYWDAKYKVLGLILRAKGNPFVVTSPPSTDKEIGLLRVYLYMLNKGTAKMSKFYFIPR